MGRAAVLGGRASLGAVPALTLALEGYDPPAAAPLGPAMVFSAPPPPAGPVVLVVGPAVERRTLGAVESVTCVGMQKSSSVVGIACRRHDSGRPASAGVLAGGDTQHSRARWTAKHTQRGKQGGRRFKTGRAPPCTPLRRMRALTCRLRGCCTCWYTAGQVAV